MGRAILLLLVISAVFFVSPALGINCKGCTPLDTLTFDKMVKSFPVSDESRSSNRFPNYSTY